MKTVILGEIEEKFLGDKKELFYTLKESGDLIGELKSGLPETTDMEAIRKELGLNAGECQADVIGFIKKLTSS